MKNHHPDEQALRDALAAKANAESVIQTILARHRMPNKTQAKYLILGLCPNCGGEKEEGDGYYCDTCRKKHTRLISNKAVADWQNTVPDERYSNDTH